jgi:hypothetical protein
VSVLASALLFVLQGARVEPRASSWQELARDVFDPAWILPFNLPLAPGEKGWAVELEVELARVVSLVVEPSATDPDAPRCFGDLVRATRELDAAGIERLLGRFAEAQPELARALEPFARELLPD